MPTRKLSLKAPDCDVAVCDQAATRTVTPAGEIDLATVGSVRGPLQAALSNGFEQVVLDLSETTFIDSTGIHLVLELSTYAEAQAARFDVLPGPPAVHRIFELCGLEELVSRDGNGV